MGWKEDHAEGTKIFPGSCFLFLGYQHCGGKFRIRQAEGNFEILVHHGCETKD